MRRFDNETYFNAFEALWSKIFPPDLKTSVYFFLLTLYLEMNGLKLRKLSGIQCSVGHILRDSRPCFDVIG